VSFRVFRGPYSSCNSWIETNLAARRCSRRKLVGSGSCDFDDRQLNSHRNRMTTMHGSSKDSITPGRFTVKRFILTALILSLDLDLLAQAITNVVARQEGEEMIVTYDLNKSLNEGEEVTIGYTTDYGATWSLISPTGDVGRNIQSGRGKTIRWLIDPEVADRTLKFKVNIIDRTNMVWVEGGTFQMGSNSGDSDEKPVHTVTVKGFWMGKYEVTQAEYRRVMGTNPSRFQCDDCPVENVSWNDAVEYAKRVGGRLPTEAEWEYAARGGNQSRNYKYSGSDNLDEVGWYSNNSGNKTHPIGQKKPNELGLYDMAGNVWEWCQDGYDEGYYAKSPRDNPTGPSYGSHRVLRGGSWSGIGYGCRLSLRNRLDPVNRGNYIGFRCVRDF